MLQVLTFLKGNANCVPVVNLYIMYSNCHPGGIYILCTLAPHAVTSSPQLATVIGASLSAVVLIIGISAVFVAVLVIVCIYK